MTDGSLLDAATMAVREAIQWVMQGHMKGITPIPW